MRRDLFAAWMLEPARPPLVMGVLNITPDSFSDGGQFASPRAAADHAEALLAGGADWLDVGGESTRPGSPPVPPAEQIRRVVPVLREIDARCPGVLTSIDTTSAEVAEAALDAGAAVVNDISAGRNDPDLLPLAARRNVAVVLMHMQGAPQTMQIAPRYDDVVSEVGLFLRQRRQAAIDAGVRPDRVLLDPGIGFGKTLEHNLLLLKHTRQLADLGSPLLIGTSRKGFIGRITGESVPARRQYGTAATVCWVVANGAAVVRVHDVAEMVQVVRMTRALMLGREP